MTFSKKILDYDFNRVPQDFTGTGIVVYKTTIESLPVIPLVRDSVLDQSIIDETEILTYLISISRYEDHRHDGFHFVHVNKGLTHISQFFSPPIPNGYCPNKFGIGARYRASEIGSLLEEIFEIIVLGRDGEVSVFNKGVESQVK
jgi:hypothetical protein